MILGYVVLIAAAVVALTFAFAIVKYYQCPDSAQAFTTLTASACIAFLLMSVLVIPVDVYNSNAGVSAAALHQTVLRDLYYGIYMAIIAMLFTVLPFAYFLHDEEGEHATYGSRICSAVKASLCVVVVAVVLVATGVFAFHKLHDSSGTSDLEWVKSVFQDQSMFSFTIYYCIAVMSAIGCVLWASYTAYGMAALPLSMMRGFLSDETNDEETQTLLDQERSIQSRAARTGERLSRRDMRALQRLRRDAEAAAAEASPQPPVPDAILSRLILVVEPFYRCRANCVGRVVSRDTCSRLIGFIFALVSLLLAASWITGARAACCIRAPAPTPEKGIYDSLSHSSCGLKCGFMIDKPTKGSPVDAILLAASIFFPLDFVLLTFIIFYLMLCSFHGMVSLGVRCICIKLFAIKKRATQPQGLLLLCMYLSLLVSAMQWQIASLAPQYTSFGDQKYEESRICDASAPANSCSRTVISSVHATVAASMLIFGPIFFGTTLVFVSNYFLSGVWSIMKQQQQRQQQDQHRVWVDDDDI